MRKAAALVLLVLLFGTFALAQAPTTDGKLSRYIFTETERINPAMFDAYSRVLAQARSGLDSIKSSNYWLAMSPLTGDGGTVHYVMFVNSIAEVDKMIAEFDKIEKDIAQKDPSFKKNAYESVTSMRMELMEMKPELSLSPLNWVAASEATRYRVVTVTVKPGMTGRYAAMLKELIALEKDVPGMSWITYQSVVSDKGAVFAIVTPLKALADLDVDHSAEMSKIFTPLMMRDFEQRVSNIVAESSSTLFMVQPSLSRVPPSFVAANPSYWTIKEEPTAVAQKGKKVRKEAVPAAMKTEEKK